MNKLALYVLTLLLLFYVAVSSFEINIPYWLGLASAGLSIATLVFAWLKPPSVSDTIEDVPIEAIPIEAIPAEPLVIAETVRRQEYVDKITKLGNRSFFDARLDVLLIPERLSGEGALTLISLTGLEEANQSDELNHIQQKLLSEAAILIENSVSDYANAIISRVSTLEFAVIVHPISKNQTRKIATAIEKGLDQLQFNSEPSSHPRSNPSEGNFFHIGVTSFDANTSRFELLANADLALRSAQLKGGSGWHQLDEEMDKPIWGMVQWRTFFERTLATEKIQLYLQPVLDLETRELVHSEVFARLKDHQGMHIYASEFIPMAAACGVLPKIDRMVINKLLAWYLQQPKSNQRLCINLSIDSLLDDSFIDWLIHKLSINNLSSKFIIEFPERPSLHPQGNILKTVNKLNQAGIEVGIDHVGEQLVDLGYLEWFPISYLKIHQSIIYSLSNEQHHHHELLILSLSKFADSKGFLLMAEGIEKESQIKLLDELGISAGQGFFLGTPYQLELTPELNSE